MDQTASFTPRPALQYDGRIGELYRIFLVNLLLSIITIGIYRFWAITRYRRYLWTHFRFQGEPFEYTGRGGELFLGLLMAFGILLGLGALTAALGFALRLINPALGPLALIPFYIIIFIFAGAARFSAQRYRLSRTLWCGIRGGMVGSALAYGLRSFLYMLLLPLTLFQLGPWVQIRLAERRISASRLGSAEFSFRGRARRIYPIYLATFVGSVLLFALIAAAVWLVVAPALLPVMGAGKNDPRLMFAMQRLVIFATIGLLAYAVGAGLIASWYWASLTRHIIGNTTLDRLQLDSLVTGPALLWLLVGNALIALFTLGLGLPFVLQRSARFLARTLLVTGTLDVEALRQSTLAMPRTGEGMLQMLDHGSII